MLLNALRILFVHWNLKEWDDTEIPQQIEFARLNVTKMVMSKRKLRALVEAGLVAGWDDPRMPTISGLRRRGYTPEAIRDFCDRIGVAKADSIVDIALLEFCIREDLKLKAKRPMVVVDPVKVIITNYPEGKTILKMKNLVIVKLYLAVKSISNAVTLWKNQLRNFSA